MALLDVMVVVVVEQIILQMIFELTGVFIRLGALRSLFSLIWRKIFVLDEPKG